VYLRPFGHQQGDLSIEATNVAMVKQIADALLDEGFTPGRAAPIPLYRGDNKYLVGVAVLALPSLLVLLLGFCGRYRVLYAVVLYGGTILFYLAGAFSSHDAFVRSVIALCAALAFAAAAFLAMAGAFLEEPAATTGAQILRSLKWTLVVAGVAMLGALAVVGLMSFPLAMEEIERFRGVKLVLVLPPLIALALYLFSGRFGTEERPAEIFGMPVRAYHLLILAIVGAVGALLIMRSGNQSDIAPSAFELSLRHGLTAILNVRPRFKLFLFGVPMLMLAPALLVSHRRAVGWLLALGAGVGIGDIIDTFSHLHTSLAVSLLRIFNGLWVGAIIGIVLILIYRAIVRRIALRTA
ncbi:MAG: DUF5693 family protein, partial [Candidatus Eremiobacteraeota bacterium]|nr:DUF5693 family protein [Candidatus Eremiobacteraeota bacterium]